ncbi:unnamed protein product [Amoebophrya sp. A25]|nr:unnamed protein product [Amoebophrya sp. A25]|eukprot:GSA25T00011912001.1
MHDRVDSRSNADATLAAAGRDKTCDLVQPLRVQLGNSQERHMENPQRVDDREVSQQFRGDEHSYVQVVRWLSR